MAGLVGQRVAFVEAARVLVRRTRHRAPVDDDAIQVCLRRVSDLREICPAEEVAAARRVDVERAVVAPLQGLLHLVLGTAGARGIPPRVVRPGHPGEGERESAVVATLSAPEPVVEDGDLGVDLLARQVAEGAVGDDVEPDRHRGREVRRCLALGASGQVLVHLAGVLLAGDAIAPDQRVAGRGAGRAPGVEGASDRGRQRGRGDESERQSRNRGEGQGTAPEVHQRAPRGRLRHCGGDPNSSALVRRHKSSW